MNSEILSLNDVAKFDDSADVIVIGYGIAGSCAALEARRHGGDVLVVERASAGGGASALSSGLFYLGGGTQYNRPVAMRTARKTCTALWLPVWALKMPP